MSEPGKSSPATRPDAQIRTAFWASRRSTVLAGAFLALATLAAYHNSFSVPFVFDDYLSIRDNPTIRHLWPIQQVLSTPGGAVTVSGRPLVNLSLALNYAFGGMAVRGYHALNLAVHILASLTLFGIVRRTLLQPAMRPRFGVAALPLALAVALLWAVHPLQTESVTYIVQRAESLMGLFYLLTLYCFIRGTESRRQASGLHGGTEPRRMVWSALAIASCVLGMAAKEVMVSAPLLVLLYDRTFVAGTFQAALQRRWRLYAGLAAGWLLLAFESGGQKGELNATMSGWAYALTQLWAIVHYLWLSVWPHPLVFDYGTILVTRAAQVVPSALIVALLAGGTIVGLRYWPALGFLGCWFFAILAPTSSLIPLAGQTVAEHRMYLPLAAVIALGVLGIYRLAGRRSLVLFPMAAVALVFLTARRNEDYRSELALWRDTVASRPVNARAHNDLGKVLLEIGRTNEAIAEFQTALVIEPGGWVAQNNLGNALLHNGQMEEAIAHFQKAIEARPNYEEAYNNLGYALLVEGQVDPAIRYFQKALEIRPDFATAHNNLGNALFRKGQVDEAIAHYQKAVEIQPDYANAHINLGSALLQKGRMDEAIAHYQTALRIQPDFAGAYNNLCNIAWLLATCPDASVRNGAKAVELAQQADRVSGGNDPAVLGVLAAAYAEAGRFTEAVAAAQRALQLATARANTALADDLRMHLGFYRAGSPFRDTSQTNTPASPAGP